MAERIHHFERLTPVDDINLEVYEEAIDCVFSNPDIKNVAISGAYSAGKSSVLASYKKKRSDLNFLHISLAHFKSPEQEGDKEENVVKEAVLEGKILNQLIHQIPSEKIPQTNFRVKKRVSQESVVRLTVETVLLLIAVVHFACFDMWKEYVNTLPCNVVKYILSISTHQYMLILDGILLVAGLSHIVYWLISLQRNKNLLRRLNVKGNEIEIFDESDDSYFDKYLNEVLYLFENSGADVIVFEDIDRFNANSIFERLREVNTLVNIQLQKENEKVIRFFFLLRDDIFDSKDRTKFFDYIVPVVPVVDGSNSYDQCISIFKKSGVIDKFDETFLQGLSLYIDDMRLLKNIYNEFVIYYNRLNTTELDCNKMLAIITYKNLFPQDFAGLQLNQGFVYTLFSQKANFINDEIMKLEKTIKEKQQRVSSAQNEHLVSMRELDVAFADRSKSYNGRINYNDLNNFTALSLRGDDKTEYISRKQALEDKLNGYIDVLQKEIADLERNVNEIENKQLHQLITRYNINKVFDIKSINEIGKENDFKEVKSSGYFDLLKYLVRNGYIDETYADYMTYFYGNSLSRIDKIFLRSITDKRAKEYNYHLKNPELISSRLRLVDFGQEETLNFDLLTYLLQNQSQGECLDRFFDQLRETRNFKFIGAYFDVTILSADFTNHLNIRWPELFKTVLEEKALPERQIRKFSVCTLYSSADDTIKEINLNNCLCDYISNARDYLAIDEPKVDKLIHGFSLLGVRFVGFDYETLNIDLFKAVYEKSLYKITAENLRLIQTEILGVKNDGDIAHKNYTILLSHRDSAITQYISRNINEYFDVALQMSEEIILDEENVAIAVLNNPELTIEHKQMYISALRTTISHIEEIRDTSLWISLLDAEIVQYSEWNIMECFNTVKLNGSVISYINRCDKDLDFSKTEYDEDEKSRLFDAVIVCNELHNLKYKQILTSLKFYYDNFDIAGVSDDKLTVLIDTDIIKMTADNLKFIRENYQNMKDYFIGKDIETYIDIMNESLFSQEELLEILEMEVGDELKIKLLEFSDCEISIVGKKYSNAVCLHILNHNFAEEDLPELFSSFERWDNSIQIKILDYAVEKIASIIDSSISASRSLRNVLLHSDKVGRGEKIDLLIGILPELEEDVTKDVLNLLNLPNYLKIFDSHSRPKFEIDEENKKLLTAFKENDIIDGFYEKEGYYRISRVKSTTN